MVTTRAANGIRKPCNPYRPPSVSRAPATPARLKKEGARKASSSAPETPVKKRKSPNAHIQQTPPPKLRFNLQEEVEDEAWDEAKPPLSSVRADDVWVFSNLPIMLRPGPMKDDTDTIREDLIAHSEDDEERVKMVELPEEYLPKRFTVQDALFGDGDEWATDYESDKDVSMKLAISPPKPRLNNNGQYKQWDEEFMMSDTELIHSDQDFLTVKEDKDKIGLGIALDLDLAELHEEAAAIERAHQPGPYDTYFVTSDADTPYDYEKNEPVGAERLLGPVQEYSTWPVAAKSSTPQDSEDDDLYGEWSSKKKCKVTGTIEEKLDTESLNIFQEESKYACYAENEDKPKRPRLIRSSGSIECGFDFTELQAQYTIEKVPQDRLCGDDPPLALGSSTFVPSSGCAAQLATPPDSNRGSVSPRRRIRMDLDRNTCPSTLSTTPLFANDSSPELKIITQRPTSWDCIVPQHFPGHAKHLCKSGRTPQAELEYTCANSGFNTSFIDELDRMYPRKNKPVMDDAVMPRTGRRAPVTEKTGDFVLAEDYTATKGRSRAQLQYWPSA